MSSVLDDLKDGYRQFRSGKYTPQKSLYETLGRHGQSPRVMVISCADSRVNPTDIFNADPGDMFVARNVANIVPPNDAGRAFHDTSAAIEYAVTAVDVDMIIVMGHEACGGVAGCLKGMGDNGGGGSHVGAWVSLLNEARDRVKSKPLDADGGQSALELEGVRQSLANLMTFPFVKAAVDAGALKLQGAHFSIETAQLRLTDGNGEFHAVKS